MRFLRQLLDVAASTRERRPPVSRSPGLALERLEERWTPAVGISGLGSGAVTITDTDSGQTANSIQIIDDVDTLTTYIRVNNGAETQLGTAGTLVASFTLNMGKGNDKVAYSVRGSSNDITVSQTWNVDLGAGDDSISFAFGAGHDRTGKGVSVYVNYAGNGDSSGNDTYSATGDVVDSLFGFQVNEASGNDVYNFAATSVGTITQVKYTVADVAGNDKYAVDEQSSVNALLDLQDSAGNDSYSFSALAGANTTQLVNTIKDFSGNDKYSVALNAAGTGGNVSLLIQDAAGNDSYTASLSAVNDTSYTSLVIDDNAGSDTYSLTEGATTNSGETAISITDASTGGSNSLTLTQGDLSDATRSTILKFTGTAKNSIKIGGNGALSDAAVNLLSLDGGDGRESVSIDDFASTGGAKAEYTLNLGKGDDKVNVKFDGKPNSGLIALAAGASETFTVDLGDGKNSYEAELDGSKWSADTASAATATSLSMTVDGGSSDDDISFKAANSKTIYMQGSQFNFTTTFNGGSGNDTIDVDLGNVFQYGMTSSSLVFNLNGGIGADKIKVGGALAANFAGPSVAFSVDLGTDSGPDSFKSSLKVADSVVLPLQFSRSLDVHHVTAGLDQASYDKSSRGLAFNISAT